MVVNYLGREMATEAEEGVIDRLGFPEYLVDLEAEQARNGRLQSTRRGMADLVLGTANGSSREQGTVRTSSSGSSGVVGEMIRLALIVAGLNTPHHRVTTLWALAGLLLREVDRPKVGLSRVDRWSLPCLIISMALP